MIIFKFISIGIKQNLGLECSKFYFRGKKKKKNFGFWLGQGVHLNPLGWLFEPPGLVVDLPLVTLVDFFYIDRVWILDVLFDNKSL